jgi:uncharacterized protein
MSGERGHDRLPVADPAVTEESRPFWEAAAEGRLVLPRCDACGHHVWYPRSHCPACHGTGLRWVELSGRGRIYSFSVVRRAQGEWAEHVPFVLAYVELDEGPRMVTNVLVDDPGTLAVDQPVEAVFHPTPSGSALLRFRPLPR